MSKKIVSWIKMILIFLGIIVFVSSAIILNSLKEDPQNLIHLFHSNIRNTIYIGSFIFFIILVSAYFYLPLHIKRSLGDISTILKDIKEGNYNVGIDLEEKKKILDRQVYDIVVQLSEVKKVISEFDELKKKKIIEHYNRITSLLLVISEGAIIFNENGKIIFANEKVLEIFPSLEINANILESSYAPEIENNIKKFVLSSLQEKSRQESYQFFIPNLKRHITLDSSLVRNDAGDLIGLVLIMRNLEKRKSEKKEKEED